MADMLLRDTDPDELVARVTRSVIDQVAKLIGTQSRKRLLDRGEMADVLGVSVATFDRLRTTHPVPTKWVESVPRFDADAVIAALPDVSPVERNRDAADAG